MKFKYIVFVLLTLSQFSISGQWVEKSILTNSTLSSVHFVNDDIGYATGDNQVFKTENGGESWEVSFSGDDLIFLRDIVTIDQNVVIAVGQDVANNSAFIVKTSDNGLSWSPITTVISNSLNSVFFTSFTTGYCCGNRGSIYRSIDSGETWEELNSGVDLTLGSIHFVNDSVGITVGGSTILKTANAGDTWNNVSSPSSDNLQSIHFVNQQVGYAVGWNGEIIKTIDCGLSWSTQASVNMFGNLDVVFTDENTGYVVGGQMNESSIQKTVDGGETWLDVSPNIPNGLTSVYFSSFNIGYAVGDIGTVLRTESGGVSSIDNPLYSPAGFHIFPNPSSSTVTLESINRELISSIHLYDSRGLQIKQIKIGTFRTQIDIGDYLSGAYYLHLRSENSNSIVKLIKE